MKSSYRSMTGLALAVLSLPVFLSLTACLPTSPMIGDPEKSRIDPDLNGLWVEADDPAVVLIEPYDKRTWLVTFVGFEFNKEACGVEDPVDQSANSAPDSVTEADLLAEVIIVAEVEKEDDYVELQKAIALHGIECFDANGEVLVFKAWRTEIARQSFMTWEPKGTFGEEYGFGPVDWLDFRIRKPDTDTLSLEMINFSHDAFEDNEALDKFAEEEPPYNPRTLKAATRAAERVIRKNIDDEDLFEETLMLHRVTPEDRAFFTDILDEVTAW